MQSSHALKAVAAFEALKGLVALAAASGAPLLVHRDLHQLALLLVEHTHLNPAAKYPSIFIEATAHLQDWTSLRTVFQSFRSHGHLWRLETVIPTLTATALALAVSRSTPTGNQRDVPHAL